MVSESYDKTGISTGNVGIADNVSNTASQGLNETPAETLPSGNSEEGEKPKEGHEEEHGDGDYGMDFDEYTENSEESDGSDQDIAHSNYDKVNYDNVTEEEDEDEGFIDDSDDDEYTYDPDTSNASAGLIIPDMGITRESSLVSRLNGESGIFSDPRNPSVTHTQPTLQTLSEEIMLKDGMTDHEFFKNSGFRKTENASLGNNDEDESRTSTMTSTMTTKMENMDINHSEFISNARYPESVMSADDNASVGGDDDAFSFLSNDDKKYEIGYDEEDDYYDSNTPDEDGDLTDTNATDTESVKTQENDSSHAAVVPPIPAGILDTVSVINGNHLKNEVDAQRSEFVRSDMHSSVFTRSTDFSTEEESIAPVDHVGDAKLDGESSANAESDVETINETVKDDTNVSQASSVLKSTKITQLKDIPDVDLLGLFKSSKSAEQNILTLREMREDLDKIDSGLEDWIRFNMGEGLKLGPEDEQKLGPHALEAIKNPKPISTNIVANVTNVNANVNRVTDTVENTARKLGARGKTLLRKLRHSEN